MQGGALIIKVAYLVSVDVAAFRPRRTALGGCVAAMCAMGCLDAPPSYEQRQRIQPFVIMPATQPPVDEVAAVATNRTLQVRVPFRSDDLGEGLIAVFFLNDGRIGSEDIGPSVLSDRSRFVEFTFRPEVDPGCHQLSLLLTHNDNFNGIAAKDESNAAYVYWWLNVFDPRVGPTASCPGEGN